MISPRASSAAALGRVLTRPSKRLSDVVPATRVKAELGPVGQLAEAGRDDLHEQLTGRRLRVLDTDRPVRKLELCSPADGRDILGSSRLSPIRAGFRASSLPGRTLSGQIDSA